MLFSQSTKRRIFFTFSAFLIIAVARAFAQSPPVPQLIVMQTAETLGKGGYVTSFGLLQFDKKMRTPEKLQRVIIGNFDEQHLVEFEIETFLVPARLTYGIGDPLDLILGATFSTGGVRKILPDFYRLGDAMKDEPPLDSAQDRRVYDQSLFDAVIGLKYNMKPEAYDDLPSVSIGGEVQIGFTADDELNSDKEFIDKSPANSFPFIGISTYLAGTQRFGSLVKAHATIGSYLSSKSIDTSDSLLLIWQLGGEFVLSENLWLISDFSRKFAISGVRFNDLLSIGFRYELSATAAFSIGYASEPGFQFYLTIGGEKERDILPQSPEGGDLLF